MDMSGKQSRPRWRWDNLLENLFIVILVFYPLRHISWGLDLWDTGYNYANFQYMGTEHMDPMWLFSTYLANVVGNLLTKLPNADSLMGMNLYTGLFVSALALIGYFFCTRKLKMPGWVAFAGEMTAISLCWCPTAVLYNYLTYVLFLVSTIFLYIGLTKESKGYLVCAGVLLGSNVLVRFSNLPEMGMIAAVWGYDVIVWLEGRKKGEKAGFWQRTARHTLWCFLGYLGALAFWLSYIHICYGINEYIAGIGRLFAMTENAQDYKPASMLAGVLNHYVENLYWAVRVGVIVAGGVALFAVAGWFEQWLAGHFGGKQGDDSGGVNRNGSGEGGRQKNGKSTVSGNSVNSQNGRSAVSDGNSAWKSLPGVVKAFSIGMRVLWAAVSIAMVVWLYSGNFTSFLFYSYDPIWHPGPVFLMLAMLIALVRIFHPDAPKEEKLVSGMVILIILLTPIGSNNGVLPSLNNLFLAAPYMLWESWRFLRYVGDTHLKFPFGMKKGLFLCSFPAKGILVAFLGLCLFQFGCFGAKFAFAEATGIQEATTVVENLPVLKNIKMSPEKARWIGELGAYINEEGLQGKEAILYGDIPSLSYYLQMPSAFNPWSDLDSYQSWVMEGELEELEGNVLMKGAEKPVVILEDGYALHAEQALYGEQASDGQGALGLSEENREGLEADAKWMRLLEFMDSLGYEQAFRNEKFAVYR